MSTKVIVREHEHVFNQSYQTVLAEAGEPITLDPRRRLEAALGADLSDVRVHASRASAAAASALNAKAFALGENVCLSDGAEDLHSPEGFRLLAHEVAHVLQQRLARGARLAPVSRERLEQEADAAADAAVAGRSYRCTVADTSGQPALWGLCGHYYMPYLMFLNAGADAKTAQRLGLWCWLPDQVQELDAAHIAIIAGKNMGDAIGRSYFPDVHWVAGKSQGVKDFTDNQWHGPRDNLAQHNRGVTYAHELQYVEAIQTGLHVLTGKSSEAETDRRTKIFNGGKHLKLLYRGLCLHPYGDTFAHREFKDSSILFGKAYGLPLGHGRLKLEGEDPHSPDYVWEPRRAVIFQHYVHGLSQLAGAFTGKEPIVPFGDLMAALSALNPNMRKGLEPLLALQRVSPAVRQLADRNVAGDEMACVKHIRLVAQQLVGRTMAQDDLADRRDSVPWEAYYRERASALFEDSEPDERDSASIFYGIQKRAVEWSTISLSAQRLPSAADRKAAATSPVGPRGHGTLPPAGFPGTTGWARRPGGGVRGH